ncbi:response regulator [Desulfonatronum sp. SC1]|uniref:response regulator n=1 Tax=Desulfonatronum sp. SC1 TaxID=2109626 RepID=UPI000D323B06|nr:response regulator [Desulfonatronum sp. SC1]PTN38636.1 response regulator [Desulfonatronum sp. SC1]
MKVLIVDDDLANRVVLQSFLRDKASRINMAANGEEAVQAFVMALDEQAPYTLILMDIIMPVMDGHGALETIREAEKDRGVSPGSEVKVIMVSCLEDQKNVCQAFFHGMATCYLTKPLSKEGLETALSGISL